MSEKLNLKELERKAWRSFFDDGLWDIFLGLLLATMGVSGLLDHSSLTENWAMTIYIGLLVVIMLSFWLAKRFITVPRIGRVKFGHKRKVRRIKTALVLFVSVVFGLIVMFLTAATGSGIMPAIWAINMLVVFGAMGYFLDFERLYFIGLMYAIAIPLNEILIALEVIRIGPYIFFVCGAITVAMGIFYLVRFLNNYPVIQLHA